MAVCQTSCSPECKYGQFQSFEENDALQPNANCKSETAKERTGNGGELMHLPTEGSGGGGQVPCYLPQAHGDSAAGTLEGMGPIGPWATGRVDWSPLAGLTGTRPVVSKYSITRYSEAEWRQRNADVLNGSHAQQYMGSMMRFDAEQSLESTQADVAKEQAENTKRLARRGADVHRWKCELERAIEAATEELHLLKEQFLRLKHAMAILTVPESIAAECLDIRANRLEPDLVRDEVEEELIKELALTAEVRDMLSRTLTDLTAQIVEERAAKQRLEFDWSDKKTAYDNEAFNVALNNRSTVVMFKPGAIRMPEEQSTNEYWEHFTRESLFQGERTRQKAAALRGTLDAILTNASRDLRTQADRVDGALNKRITCTQQLIYQLEIELKKILQEQVDFERLTDKLQQAIRNMDFPMKVAQTRLDNKLCLPRVENCRDESNFQLINEVKSISNKVAELSAQLQRAEDCKSKLVVTRGTLEREIMIKLKNLWIDRDRIQMLRSHYPSATALSGY